MSGQVTPAILTRVGGQCGEVGAPRPASFNSTRTSFVSWSESLNNLRSQLAMGRATPALSITFLNVSKTANIGSGT